MQLKPFLAASTVLFASIAASNALTISNLDDVHYVLEIVEGVGESSVETINLEASRDIEGICNSGCTITLSNGVAQSFFGDEWMTIEEGQFVHPD